MSQVVPTSVTVDQPGSVPRIGAASPSPRIRRARTGFGVVLAEPGSSGTCSRRSSGATSAWSSTRHASGRPGPSRGRSSSRWSSCCSEGSPARTHTSSCRTRSTSSAGWSSGCTFSTPRPRRPAQFGSTRLSDEGLLSPSAHTAGAGRGVAHQYRHCAGAAGRDDGLVRRRPGWQIVLLPIVLIQAVALALGVGTLVSAISIENRDWERALAFLLSLGLWLSR